jgi:hypothetical protein
MERSTEGNTREQSYLNETDGAMIVRKGHAVGSDRNLPDEVITDQENPLVSNRSAPQGVSCLACETCGKVLGSGKDHLAAVISASSAGMITVIRAVGFWYVTRHFCGDCGRKRSAKPLRSNGFVSS